MPKRSVTILDHRINNLENIVNAFTALGVDVHVANHPEQVRGGGHLLVPGVGAFTASMNQLHATGLDECMCEHVAHGDPLMGICLGYQVLFEGGYEGGHHKALGLLKGQVKRFDTDLPLPHVGWNQVDWVKQHPLSKGFKSGSHFYFVHSYRPEGMDPGDVLGQTDYDETFACAAARDNVVGTQFHPELSGAHGLRLLLNFVDWRP